MPLNTSSALMSLLANSDCTSLLDLILCKALIHDCLAIYEATHATRIYLIPLTSHPPETQAHKASKRYRWGISQPSSQERPYPSLVFSHHSNFQPTTLIHSTYYPQHPSTLPTTSSQPSTTARSAPSCSVPRGTSPYCYSAGCACQAP